MPQHEFWDEGFSYSEVDHRPIQGAKQVTDAWLVALATQRGGKLMTMDAAVAVLYRENAELLPP